jgi:hypothetical protein
VCVFVCMYMQIQSHVPHLQTKLNAVVIYCCRHLSTPVHTCRHLFTPVDTCSHFFTPVHTCRQLFTPVDTCSHLLILFTPAHTCRHLSTQRCVCVCVESLPTCTVQEMPAVHVTDNSFHTLSWMPPQWCCLCKLHEHILRRPSLLCTWPTTETFLISLLWRSALLSTTWICTRSWVSSEFSKVNWV